MYWPTRPASSENRAPIETSSGLVLNTHSSSHRKNKPNSRNSEDSEFEYDPLADDTSEGDLHDDDNVKVHITTSINMMFSC